jgi:stage II sporulation protein R
MKRRIKLNLWEKALLCALCFSFLIEATGFSAQCQDISAQVLRLHVLANSDSEEDQALKLLVRDRILEESGALFAGAGDKAQAVRLAEENREALEQAAQACVEQAGYDYPVSIRIEKVYFPTKVYGETALPAGMYDAVRVEIGEAAGQNWWCVVFPALCLPAAQEEDLLGEVLTEGEQKLVERQGGYKIGFKSVELWETLRSWLTGGKE